jgi:hypothetical protein
MWLIVERVDDPNRNGVLESQPVVFAPQLSLGQELAVSFDNICEHLPQKKSRLQRSTGELSIPHDSQKILHRQQPGPLGLAVGILDRNWHYQRQLARLHLRSLAPADSCLERQ